MAQPAPPLDLTCRICHRHLGFSSLTRLTGRVCKICADAGNVDLWQAELNEARAHLARAERAVVALSDRSSSRRTERSAHARRDKARQRERRASFRLISAQLIGRTRELDQLSLADLDDARRGSRFGKTDAEADRRFAAYVDSRLQAETLDEEEFADIVRVCQAMTRHSQLSEIRGLDVDVSIALANGDVFLPVDPPEQLVLRAAEALWVWAAAGLWEPSRLVQSETAKGGLTAPLGLGAKVGLENAHTVTTERVGAFHETTAGIVAVSNQRVIFVNGRTLSIGLRDVVALGADRDSCVLHYSGSSSPVLLAAPQRASLVAAA